MRDHPKTRTPRAHARAAACALALAGWVITAAAGAADLDGLADRLARRFDTIAHITPATLATWRAQARDLILLDVRSRAEYAVGHIPGAVHVAPETNTAGVMARIDRPLEGATVVAYCSVGQRSSTLLRNARHTLRRAGAERIANLRGGVFAWHNQRRPLADVDGATEWVHPYSERWGRYLDRPSKAAYEPRD